jgi:hypothetical protein
LDHLSFKKSITNDNNFIAEPALFSAGYFFKKSEDSSLVAQFIFKFERPSFKF